jgi:hypothetical protein
MSETKFTKGLWTSNGHSCVSVGSKVLCVFTDSSVNTGDETEDYANAHLVSAAPEMYALLDEISDGLLEAGGFGNCELAKRIEALLAKARGDK